jgi:hypothetical protein
MTEHDPTALEQREAEALARALEGEADEGAPADALETAGLVRAAGREAAWTAERSRAVLDRIAPALGARRSRWKLALVALPAAAAILVAVATSVPVTRRAAAVREALPQPSAALLAVQARAARGEASLDALDGEMRAYRMQVYAALARRYGERR